MIDWGLAVIARFTDARTFSSWTIEIDDRTFSFAILPLRTVGCGCQRTGSRWQDAVAPHDVPQGEGRGQSVGGPRGCLTQTAALLS